MSSKLDAGTAPLNIYVACLASYNAGTLFGTWIDCWGKDTDQLAEEVEAMLANSPAPGAEEWAIHDHEGFEGFDLGENSALSDIADMVALLEEHGEVARSAARLCVNDLGRVKLLCEDAFEGEWRSLEEYAEHVLEGQVSLPDRLAGYFDYAAFGRDMELGGDVTTVEAKGRDHIHVFNNHV